VFHATHIWSGTGPIFKDRDRWPLAVRLEILRDLARIPALFQIPIVFYGFERSRITFDGIDNDKLSANELLVAAHGHDVYRLHPSH
jgi:hypothetical protein